MNNDITTASQFMQAANATKASINTETLRKGIHLDVAIQHNLRRKLDMINSMKALYHFQHGNGNKPETMPSKAFNPNEGSDKTNIYYFFKEMKTLPPWELEKQKLVEPVALTFLLIDTAEQLYPSPVVGRLKCLVEEFINRWILPKFREEWDDARLADEIERYKADMDDFEKRFTAAYNELSIYFRSLEEPRMNPIENKINETSKKVNAIAAEVCHKEMKASFIAQQKAHSIWKEYSNCPEVKLKYCKKSHRVTYADVFDYCKRLLLEFGFKTLSMFRKAVKAAVKRLSRVAKETSSSKRDISA